jgi:hypothetical protein
MRRAEEGAKLTLGWGQCRSAVECVTTAFNTSYRDRLKSATG